MIKKQYEIGDKIGGERSVIDIFGGKTILKALCLNGKIDKYLAFWAAV